MDFSTLVGIIEEAGYRAYSYSGRNMYGKHCVGFTTDNTFPATIANLFNSALFMNYDDTETVAIVGNLAARIRFALTDDMGLSTVVYFPRVTWEGE